MNTQQRKELVLSYLTKGQIGNIKFLKKDGTERVANVKLFVERGFSSGDRNNVQVNTTADKPNIVTMYDVGNDKWIKVDMTNVIMFKAGKEVFEFNEQVI